MATTPNYLLSGSSTPANQIQDSSLKAPVPAGVKVNAGSVAANAVANRKYDVTGALITQPSSSSTTTVNSSAVSTPKPISSQIPNQTNTPASLPVTDYAGRTKEQAGFNTVPLQNNPAPQIPATIDQSVTDLSKIDTKNISPANFKYGKDASASGINVPQRNYQLGAYYASKGMKDQQSIYNDLNNNPAYAGASEQDKQTTAQNILAQANKFTSGAVVPEQKTDTSVLDNTPAGIALREMSNLNLDTANTLKQTLQQSIDQQTSANLIKDQYDNFDEISTINNNVLNQFTASRKALLDQGKTQEAGQTPTGAEIQSIATTLGYTPDQVKSALNGTIWQGLKANGTQTNTLSHDRFVEDQTTQKDRAMEDLSDNLRITSNNINNSIADIQQQAQRTAQSTAVAGGLSGAIQSNGFAAGLQNIKDDAQKNISRLTQQLDDIQHADIKDRTRLIEDFNKNITRAQTDYDTQMKDLKQNVGVAVTGVQSEYGMETDTMTKKLTDLLSNQQIQTNAIGKAYYDNLDAANKSLYSKSDALLDHQKKQADAQKSQADNLFRDDGIVLMGLTSTQLQQQVKDGLITPQTYDTAIAGMIGKAAATLGTMGEVTDKDVQSIQSAIKSGKSVSEAIGGVINDGTNRFQNLTSLYKQAQINNLNSTISSRESKSGATAVNTGNIATSALTVADGTNGGQCVKFVTDVLKQNGQSSPFVGGDQSIQSKIAQINSQTPTVGSIIVRKTANSGPGATYGDVAIVTGVNGDTVTIKGSNAFDANGNETEQVYTQNINVKDPNVYGYYDPAKVTDAEAIAQSVIDGKQPPDLKGLYSKAAPVKAILAKKGYDLSTAVEDRTATQKYLATLNGSQQTKLRQSVDQVAEQIPLISDLSQKAENALSKSGITDISKIQVNAAKQGLYGEDAKQAFTQLDSQTAELVSELASIYKGGNSSTDASLEEAQKQLSANWDFKTFQSALELINKNITIRSNSLKNAGVAGVAGSYLPDQQAGSTLPEPKTTTSSSGEIDISSYKPTFKK